MNQESNDRIRVVGTNIAEKATVIWNVADMLRGPFKPHEYGLVILPMTVVKRFHDCLLPTHDAVLAQYEKVKNFDVKDGFLTKAAGYQFYNTSKFTFDSLLADPENIESNFRDYLNGFSANVQDVLSKFDFDNIINSMQEIYGSKCVQIQYPVKTGPDFHEIIDVLIMKKLSWGPDGGAPKREDIPAEEMDKALEQRTMTLSWRNSLRLRLFQKTRCVKVFVRDW